jgi:hypothetical protein
MILALGCAVIAGSLVNAGHLVGVRRDGEMEFAVAVELLDCLEMGAPVDGTDDPIAEAAESSGVLARPEGRYRFRITRTRAEGVDALDLATVTVALDDGSEREGVRLERLLRRPGTQEGG